MPNESQPAPDEPTDESLEENSGGQNQDASKKKTAKPAGEPAATPLDSSAEAVKQAQPPKAGKNSVVGRLTSIPNFYLYLNILLLLVAGVVIAGAFILNKPPKPKKISTSSLTSQQLAQLQGSTTIVGDSSQILDIQSSSVFEGGVLAKGDINLVGNLKVGKQLSIPSLSVNGNGTFSQLDVSNNLNVGGELALQGQLVVKSNLNVQGSGSFNGSLSAGQLNVGSLQLSGDLVISKHIISTGGNPVRTLGSAIGVGGTASVSGSDTAGTVSINTGSSPPSGCFVTINYKSTYATTPRVVISPSNSSAAGLSYYTNRSASGFSICSAGVPAGGANFVFDYIVIQ